MRTPQQISSGEFRINERVAKNLVASGVPQTTMDKLMGAKTVDGESTMVQGECPADKTCKPVINGVKFAASTDESTAVRTAGGDGLIAAMNKVEPGAGDANRDKVLQAAHLFRVSPFWLIFAYMIVTLGELMLSPMGLSLVSKVAPISKRGLLMGGWFVATAIGNKLTQIGVFWDIWLQSTFFVVLAGMALVMAVVLFAILKPLKKAMPGV